MSLSTLAEVNMTQETRKIVNREENIFGEYHGHNIKELNDTCASAIAKYVLPEFAETAQFNIQKYHHPYDESTYVGFFLIYKDYEKNDERLVREAKEEQYKIAQEAREHAEFQRLSKKFSQ